jgi:hypothetical protein
MNMVPNVLLGELVVGEKPAPLQYQFLDSSGKPIDITSYTAKFIVRERLSLTATQFNASVTDGPNGIVTYTWVGTEFTTPGRWLGEIWVGNNVQRFASILVEWDARLSLGTVPSI